MINLDAIATVLKGFFDLDPAPDKMFKILKNKHEDIFWSYYERFYNKELKEENVKAYSEGVLAGIALAYSSQFSYFAEVVADIKEKQ